MGSIRWTRCGAGTPRGSGHLSLCPNTGACIRRTATVTADRRRSCTCSSGSVAFYARVHVSHATVNGGTIAVPVHSPYCAAACRHTT